MFVIIPSPEPVRIEGAKQNPGSFVNFNKEIISDCDAWARLFINASNEALFLPQEYNVSTDLIPVGNPSDDGEGWSFSDVDFFLQPHLSATMPNPLIIVLIGHAVSNGEFLLQATKSKQKPTNVRLRSLGLVGIFDKEKRRDLVALGPAEFYSYLAERLATKNRPVYLLLDSCRSGYWVDTLNTLITAGHEISKIPLVVWAACAKNQNTKGGEFVALIRDGQCTPTATPCFTHTPAFGKN